MRRKLRGIGYPYVMLSVACCIFTFLYFLVQGHVTLTLTLVNFELSLCGFGVGTLWFLSTLLVSELLVYWMLRKLPGKSSALAAAGLTLAGVGLAWYLTKQGMTGANIEIDFKNVIPKMFPAFLIRTMIAAGAVYFGFVLEKFLPKQQPSKYRMGLYVAAVVFVFIYACVIGPNLQGNDLHYAKITNPVLYVFGTLFGTAAVILCAFAVEKVPYLSKGLKWIGVNSIIIMTTHYDFKIVQLVYTGLNKAGLHYENHEIIFGICMFAIILSIEVLLVNIIQHTPLQYLFKVPSGKRKRDYKNER